MLAWHEIEIQQRKLCKRYNAEWIPVTTMQICGINSSLFSDVQPINGLRYKEENISGWFIWSGGDIPQEQSDFFEPMHIEHLIEKSPFVLPYLGLPPGWRFQIDEDGYEDVWFDRAILLS